jgi:glycosyltransferase involved in cell wall biosynthesis
MRCTRSDDTQTTLEEQTKDAVKSETMKALSFFLPYRNEASSLEATVDIVAKVAREALDSFEILLVDDHSTDESPSIARRLEAEGRAKALRVENGQGFGAGFLTGLRAAQYRFAMFLSADGDVTRDELLQLLTEWTGNRPLIQYCLNDHTRAPLRFALSRTYSEMVRRLSGTNLPYYNGFNILPTSSVKSARLQDFGFCTLAHAVLTLVPAGEREAQTVGMMCRYNDETSQALTWKNAKHAGRFLSSLALSRARSGSSTQT